IELAVLAFASWAFSRYLWILSWLITFLLVPVARMIVKRLLNALGLWERDTWIVGNGKNAYEAYKAIKSEHNLGLVIVGFICDTKSDENKTIEGLPVVYGDEKWLSSKDKRTQFILAVESNQSDIRNNWLRDLMIKGYRYVSVIPTLRGMPLDSTDVSFIFSHEVMIFRVQQNLAKWSSRLMKRCFDIAGSLTIILILS
ncbi:UDP-phosphate galactose phosphotransferase, partial [Klebsiella pneumoniae]|nr:UDP-phosphate galactose phosphotransferase [Klebsiella pneumoniae]